MTSSHTQKQAMIAETLWGLWSVTSPQVQSQVRQTIDNDADAIARHFYKVLMDDPVAGAFLDHDIVRTRLRASMAAWLQQIFSVATQDDCVAITRRNFDVGMVHARINLPLGLVNTGMRVIKKDICRRVVEQHGAVDSERLDAVLFVGEVLDLVVDNMHEAYMDDLLSSVRNQQSLKMFMTGQNLALESERLKTNLFDWMRQVMISQFDDNGPAEVPALSGSEFGMWLAHKAEFTFGPVDDLERLREKSAGIETCIAEAQKINNGAPTSGFLRDLNNRVSEVAYLLTALTSRAVELESGRDTLTRLLSRRFMGPIMQREVNISLRYGKRFAVLLVDIDHFKSINDTLGHQAGDVVLSGVAESLMANVRAGDFVFRYGGEEFLVLLAEMDPAVMMAKAEHLRESLQGLAFAVGGNDALRITASIGAALHDGHPDYERTVQAADAALYRAKNGGRNRVEAAVQTAA